jgi:hypothetical protein
MRRAFLEVELEDAVDSKISRERQAYGASIYSPESGPGSPVFLLVCQLNFHQSVYGTGDSKL